MNKARHAERSRSISTAQVINAARLVVENLGGEGGGAGRAGVGAGSAIQRHVELVGRARREARNRGAARGRVEARGAVYNGVGAGAARQLVQRTLVYTNGWLSITLT